MDIQHLLDRLEVLLSDSRRIGGKLIVDAQRSWDLIDQMRENMRYNHIERLRANDCSVDSGVLFIALVSNYEKMGDYCYNIATGVSRII